MGERPAARGRRWGRAPGARPCRARASRPGLRPPLAGHPADLLPRSEVDQAGRVLLRQGGGPFLEAGLGQLGGLRVRAPQGALEQLAPTPLELAPGRLLDEL